MYNHSLDTFKAVADTGSFSRAAELLYVSHTAVIKQINILESHLGVKLFKRSSHGTILTAAGQCLYKKTEEIRKFSEKAIQEVQEAYLASPKTIRIGTSVLYPCTIFMQLLLMRPGNSKINDEIRKKIEVEYPEIKIKDIPPHYNMATFNRPLETGGILLSLDC